MPGEKKKILVLGVGNLLMGDDGIGIHAVSELKKAPLPLSVEIIDGGTAGIDLFFCLEEADYAIIIDCLEAGVEPGAILRLPAEELGLNSRGQMISMHEIDLLEVLSMANRLIKKYYI